jgi:predicted ATPase
MIHSLKFTDDWRCFKTGDCFDFRPGVNLLVGDQGCGKSSLLKAIQNAGVKEDRDEDLFQKTEIKVDACRFFKFDFEHDNPRILSHIGPCPLFQISALFTSHGECNTLLIDNLKDASNSLVMMDEPDMALSIRSCKRLVKRFRMLADNDSQILAAVHNMAVILRFDEVYSLEHHKWMKSAEFITSHLACEHCGHHPCGCGG